MTTVLIRAIYMFTELISAALVVRVIMSWFVRDAYSTAGRIYMAIIKFTEPLVAPSRKALSRINTGMFDFSIFLSMIVIQAVANILIRLIVMIA